MNQFNNLTSLGSHLLIYKIRGLEKIILVSFQLWTDSKKVISTLNTAVTFFIKEYNQIVKKQKQNKKNLKKMYIWKRSHYKGEKRHESWIQTSGKTLKSHGD